MSHSIDLFIDTSDDLAELAGKLGQLVGTPLVPSSQDGRFVLAEGDAVALLSTHPFVDDGDLAFSRYRYVLSARVDSGQVVADSEGLALLRHVAELVRRRTPMAALLVHDLQNRDNGAGRSAPRALAPPGPAPVQSAGPPRAGSQGAGLSGAGSQDFGSQDSGSQDSGSQGAGSQGVRPQ